MTDSEYLALANRFHELSPKQRAQVLRVTEMLLHGTEEQRELLADMIDRGLPWADVWSLLERGGHA